MLRSVCVLLLTAAIASDVPGQDATALPPPGHDVVSGPCCTDAAPVGGRGGWNAGAELLILAPRFESNPAYFVTTRTASGGLPPTTTQRVEEFGYDFDAAPRVWLGYTLESGLGFRGRWFHYDHSAASRTASNPALPLGSPVLFRSVSGTSPLMAIAPQTHLPAVNSIQFPAPVGVTDRLGFGSNLYLDMWDIEAAFSDLQTGRWLFDLFGGLRYARVQQHYSAVAHGLAPQFLFSEQTYDGFGPTFGLQGRRRLGDTAFSFYGLGRISLLFGEDEHVSTGLNIGLVPDFTYQSHHNSSSRQRILPIIEIDMGIEGARTIGTGEWFVRAGVVSQLLPAGSGANGNGNMGLVGLSLGAGLRF